MFRSTNSPDFHPVEPESEPLGNAVAAEIARRAAYFDAFHAHLFESEPAERLHGGRHDSPALKLAAEPVADFDGARRAVRRFEADQSCERISAPDREDRVCRVVQHPCDDLLRLLHAVRRRHEREPASEVFALGVYGAENRRCVPAAQRTQREVVEQWNRFHGICRFWLQR